MPYPFSSVRRAAESSCSSAVVASTASSTASSTATHTLARHPHPTANSPIAVPEKDLKIIISQPKDSVIPNVSQASYITCVCACFIVPVSAVVCANIFHTLEVCDTTVSLPKMSSGRQGCLTHSVSLKGPFNEKFSNQISPKSTKYSWERLGIL
jgi:hypothetical protein